MRVVCSTVDDFLADLETQMRISGGNECVYQQTIRISISESREDSDIRYNITLQLSAVVCLPDGTQYLLECGMFCGTDYRDASQEWNGTEACAEQKDRIKKFCDVHRLLLGPGVIQI